jgi:hypothetical protein
VSTTAKRVKAREKFHRTKGKPCTATDSDLLTFQPWFLPEAIAYAIRQLLPQEHLKKMTDYYAEYGCIRCERKEVPYGGNGFCKFCRTKLQKRIWGCVRRRASAFRRNRYGQKLVQDFVNARKLLTNFPVRMYVNSQSRPGKRYGIYNPARGAFLGLNKYDFEELE